MQLFDHISLEGKAICRLVCQKTGKTIGIEYLWGTGETSTLWTDGSCHSFKRAPINPIELSDS